MRYRFYAIVGIGLIAILVLYMIGRTSQSIVAYLRLRDRVPATLERCEVVENKRYQYTLVADFSYLVQGKVYRGRERIGDLYPNPWAADRGCQLLPTHDWHVWYEAKHPEKGVLIKKFPSRQTISASVLLFLLLYFLVLFYCVQKKEGTSPYRRELD
jgi:hypothetical protein